MYCSKESLCDDDDDGFRPQVSNMLDDSFPARDFHSVVKPAIDDLMGREMTFDILFHNSEHQATLLRYGVKKSEQVRSLVFMFYETLSFPFSLHTNELSVYGAGFLIIMPIIFVYRELFNNKYNCICR